MQKENHRRKRTCFVKVKKMRKEGNTATNNSRVTELIESETGIENDGDFPKKLGKTFLLMMAFLSMGLMDIVRGPTLLDLRDLLGESVERISYIFPSFSLGSMAGSFSAGVLLDRFIKHRLLLLSIVLALIALTTTLMPYAPNLWAMCLLALVQGSASGALDTGGNVLCLDLWQGGNSGPYMHGIHFSFSVGAFIAPLLAAPFLRVTRKSPLEEVRNATETMEEDTKRYFHVESQRTAEDQDLLSAFHGDSGAADEQLVPLELHTLSNTSVEDSVTSVTSNDRISFDETEIDILYPLLGGFIFVVSIGFLFCYVHERMAYYHYEETEQADEEEDARQVVNNEEGHSKERTKSDKLIIALLSVFFFTYVGMLVTFGMFLTTFCVQSKLGLTRQEGAGMTTIFFLALAAARGVSVLAAIKLRAINIMAFSLFTCMTGSCFLALYAESSKFWLEIGAGLVGIGWSSMFATGLLWVGRYMKVTNKMGSVFTIASSAGCDLLPIVAGQLVEGWPMFLMYLQAGAVGVCSAAFAAAVAVAVSRKGWR